METTTPWAPLARRRARAPSRGGESPRGRTTLPRKVASLGAQDGRGLGVWAAPHWTVVGRRDLSAVLLGSSVEDAHVCPVVVRVGAPTVTRSWCCRLWLPQENGVSSRELCLYLNYGSLVLLQLT